MPSPSNGTTIGIPVLSDNSSSLPAGGWWARLIASSELSIKVQVCRDFDKRYCYYDLQALPYSSCRFAPWQQASSAYGS